MFEISSNTNGGGGYAGGAFKPASSTTYKATAIVEAGTNTFQVMVGGETASATATTAALPAESLDATLLDDVIYHDDAVVRIAVQAKDGLFNSPTGWRKVRVTATPSTELSSRDATSTSPSSVCTGVAACAKRLALTS